MKFLCRKCRYERCVSSGIRLPKSTLRKMAEAAEMEPSQAIMPLSPETSDTDMTAFPSTSTPLIDGFEREYL